MSAAQRAALAAALWMLACSGTAGGAEDEARFVEVPAGQVGEAIVVDARTGAEARARLLDALDGRRGAPPVAGGGEWRTIAMVRPGEDPSAAAAAGRTYVRSSRGALQLDVRLGAGDLGGFAGSVVATGALRAMIEVRVADPETIEARFRISIVQDDGRDGAPPRDVTPRYLARALPRGRYRAGLDVPETGARWIVGVVTLERGRETVAHAWASPIAIERPWLQ